MMDTEEDPQVRPLSPRCNAAVSDDTKHVSEELEEKRRQLRRQISKNRRLFSRGLSVSRLDSIESAGSLDHHEVRMVCMQGFFFITMVYVLAV